MKKLLLLIILVFIKIQPGATQGKNVEIGIRLSPMIVFNRISGNATIDDINYVFTKDGSKPSALFGIILDVPFKEDRYYISTGLFLVGKPVRFNATPNAASDIQLNQAYSTQYLQIPVGIKLFTGEIFPQKRLYFQLGGTFDVLVSRKKKSSTDVLFQKANPIDLGVLLSGGLEYEIGNNKLFAGFSYIRGLINTATKVDGLSIKNDLLSFDLGIKF